MKTVRFTIPGEPASKANSRRPSKRVSKAGNVYAAFIKSEKAVRYATAAALLLPVGARVMFAGPVAVTMRIFYRNRRSDLDEHVILDVLQAQYATLKSGARVLVRRGVYINDRQVEEKHIYRKIDARNPRAEIEVSLLIENP